MATIASNTISNIAPVYTAASVPFVRRRSSGSMMPPSQTPTPAETLNALTAYFLLDATAATLEVADAVCADMTESLLTFHVPDEQLDDDEYNLPETILPMSPEVSPRNRSASALSQVALDAASATLTSWFSFEDFEVDDEALEDEYVDEFDEDFLMDEDEEPESHEDELPTPTKLSLIAEAEDFAKAGEHTLPWTVKALGWPWVRAN